MITAIIVHFEDRRRALACAESCAAVDAIGDIVIVDNSGDLGLAPSRFTVLRSPTNRGYGAAANAGLALARAGAALVLNQDTLLTGAAVDELAAVADRSGARVVGPVLQDGRGHTAEPKRSFSAPLALPRSPRRGPGWEEVAWLAGAVLYLRDPARQRFDERLFLYGEDEELCYREWCGGGSAALATDAVVVHEGATAARRRWGDREIVLRTALSQARVVRWHRGWRGVGSYALAAARRRLT